MINQIFHDNKIPNKILILGPSGSGKTTLAKKISKKLKIKHYDLDDIFWENKFSKIRDKEKSRLKLEKLINKNKDWIIEGIFTDFSKKAIVHSNLIIGVYPSKNVRTYRLLKRHLKRKFCGSIKESSKDLIKLIKYSRNYEYSLKSSGYKEHKKILNKYPKKSILLKNKKEIVNFLKTINQKP